MKGVSTYLRRLSSYISQASSACCVCFRGHCRLLDTIFRVDNSVRLYFTSIQHPARHYFDRDSRRGHTFSPLSHAGLTSPAPYSIRLNSSFLMLFRYFFYYLILQLFHDTHESTMERVALDIGTQYDAGDVFFFYSQQSNSSLCLISILPTSSNPSLHANSHAAIKNLKCSKLLQLFP